MTGRLFIFGLGYSGLEIAKLARAAGWMVAGTCRTRGELGMLATANARYGRFYASFVRRLARVVGPPLNELTDLDQWKGEKIQTIFPIPAQVAIGESVWFDGVFLPLESDVSYQVEVRHLAPSDATVIPMRIMGGAYHRAVFYPRTNGIYQWSIALTSKPNVSVAKGAFTVTDKPFDQTVLQTRRP
jgi:hypothetical protein